jgi:hypothetical protein
MGAASSILLYNPQERSPPPYLPLPLLFPRRLQSRPESRRRLRRPRAPPRKKTSRRNDVSSTLVLLPPLLRPLRLLPRLRLLLAGRMKGRCPNTKKNLRYRLIYARRGPRDLRGPSRSTCSTITQIYLARRTTRSPPRTEATRVLVLQRRRAAQSMATTAFWIRQRGHVPR